MKWPKHALPFVLVVTSGKIHFALCTCTCSILLLCGDRQTLSRNVERKCETNNRDGWGRHGSWFLAKISNWQRIADRKKTIYVQTCSTNLANTRGINSVGWALPRSSGLSSTSSPSFFSFRSSHHLDPHDPYQHHLHHQKLCTPCTTSDGRTLFSHYCVFHNFYWLWPAAPPPCCPWR